MPVLEISAQIPDPGQNLKGKNRINFYPCLCFNKKGEPFRLDKRVIKELHRCESKDLDVKMIKGPE
jgi:hypothetical protein